jgi:alpha-glucoside transport system substrate-binding protein
MHNRPVRSFVLLMIIGLGMLLSLPARPSSAQYDQITIAAQWDNAADQQDFQRLLVPFFLEFNVQANLIGAVDLSQTLVQQSDVGSLPDIAVMSQPDLLRSYVAEGHLIPLDNAPDLPAFLADQVTVDGRVYGQFVRVEAKGLIWYNPDVLNTGAPASWDDLIGLSQQIAETGTLPWALGFNTGAPATDLIETIMLQQYGPELLNGLADGSIPWTDARVRDAWTQFGALLDTGFMGDPAGTTPADALRALLTDPPGAVLSPGSSTALRWLGDVSGSPAVDFFLLPAANGSNRVVVGGDFVVLFNDDPLTLQLADYLAAPETAAAWAKMGSAISPYRDASYPNRTLEAAAALVHDGETAFDLSDQLPADVRAAFESGALNFVANRGALDDILSGLDETVSATQQ